MADAAEARWSDKAHSKGQGSYIIMCVHRRVLCRSWCDRIRSWPGAPTDDDFNNTMRVVNEHRKIKVDEAVVCMEEVLSCSVSKGTPTHTH